jgi:hypothetical protein
LQRREQAQPIIRATDARNSSSRTKVEKEDAMSEPTVETCDFYRRDFAPGRIVESWCGKPAFDFVMGDDAKVWLCPEHLSQVGPKPVSGAA